jgi:hypothetical protein
MGFWRYEAMQMLMALDLLAKKAPHLLTFPRPFCADNSNMTQYRTHTLTCDGAGAARFRPSPMARAM